MGLLEDMLSQSGVTPPTVAPSGGGGGLLSAAGADIPPRLEDAQPMGATPPPAAPAIQKPSFRDTVKDFAGTFLFNLGQAFKAQAQHPGKRGTMAGIGAALEGPMLLKQAQLQMEREKQQMENDRKELELRKRQADQQDLRLQLERNAAILAQMKEKREAEAAAAKADAPDLENVPPGTTVLDKKTLKPVFTAPTPEKPEKAPDLTPEEKFIDLSLQEEIQKRGDKKLSIAEERVIRGKAREEWSKFSRDPEAAANRVSALQLQVDNMKATREDALRDDYEKRIGDDVARNVAYGYIKSVQDQPSGGPGDIALIYNFVKMQDPNAVRNEEIELVQKTGSLPDRWKRYLQGITEGAILDEATKARLIKTADTLHGSVQKRIEEANKDFTNTAKARNLNPANVIRSTPTQAPTQAAPGQWKIINVK